jgi:hypothetical protein
LDKARKIHWEDHSTVKVGRQEFDGVPFILLGNKVLDCQYGKDRKEKFKANKRKGKVIISRVCKILLFPFL